MLELSVIVPVYNHWHLIPRLLEALGRQTLSHDKFELVLVDNGSDHLPTLSFPSWARVLQCAVPGSYAARNMAVGAAKGKLLAFTDADCIPEPQWLEQGLACWSGARAMRLVAGGICVEPQDRKAMTASEMYDVVLGLPQQRYVRNGYAVTANLMIPRGAFEAVGLFDAKRFSGGDAEFCRRAAACGWELAYCDEARVLHPARRDFEELKTKQRRVVGGQLKNGPMSRRFKYGVALMIPPGRAWLTSLRSDRLSLTQRLRVCGVVFLLKAVGFAEMIRLLFGRTPERR